MTLSEQDKNKLYKHWPDLSDIEISYQKLLWSNAVKPTDDKKTIAGMLAVMHQFRNAPEPAIAAAQWRITEDIVDDENRPGRLYFDIGYNLITD